MQKNNDEEPYATYFYICNRLLNEYSKCVSENKKPDTIQCNYKLYLIQNLCMKPNGLIHIDDTITHIIPKNEKMHSLH